MGLDQGLIDRSALASRLAILIVPISALAKYAGKAADVHEFIKVQHER
jgi:hypothetical protein